MTGNEMAVRENMFVKKESYGTVTFANEVIATIAGLASVDIPGVAGMSGGFIDGFVELLGRKNLSKGIKVEVGKEEVAIDAAIVVDYGQEIPVVARALRESVTTAIESMTGLRVVEVNVRVQGLNLNRQKETEPGAPALVPAFAGVE